MHQPPRDSGSPDPYMGPEPGSEPDSELDLQPDFQPDLKPDSEPDSEPSFKTDAKPYPNPDSSPYSYPPSPYNNNNNNNNNPSNNTNRNPTNDSPSPSASDSASDSDSDRLHETRPNRWRGHPSTWKTWTERERRTWLALENARKEDLAVHLYNVFALRRGLRVGPDVEDGQGRGQGQGGGGGGGGGVGDGDGEGGGGGVGWKGGEGWEPGKAWTAWPMRADEVPGGGLLPRTADVNEPFTFRREQGRPFVGCDLEDEISATILRYAKERFWKRDLQGPRGNGEPVVQSIETADATTEGETDASDIGETTDQDEETDEPRRTPWHQQRPVSPTFTPVVSADDERSYALLRPATRRIMSRLDDTLMVLHNQRMAGLGSMSESSASDEEETDVEVEGLLDKAPRVRPKSRGGGRPRKVHVPREGETEQEMLIRVARENRRKLPTFSSGVESGGEADRDRSRGNSLGRGERSASVASKATSRASSGSARSKSSSTSVEANREKLLARWGLRNWRSVLGAAALAGFSPTVIARATQRCSTLFGEGMTIHTLHEKSATSGKAGAETMRAIEGFTKRINLSRHLREVHGKRAAAFTDDEEDSADEMDGGVHVDGFLQPIKMRKGWRGEDIQQRPLRSRKKARAESEELDSTPIPPPRNPHAPQPNLLRWHMIHRQTPRHMQQPPLLLNHPKLPPHPLKQIPKIRQTRLITPDRLRRVHGIKAHPAQRPVLRHGAPNIGLIYITQNHQLVEAPQPAQPVDRVGKGGPAPRARGHARSELLRFCSRQWYRHVAHVARLTREKAGGFGPG
ncbi:hypothetical protein CHGG_01954 [Chaetomium globosum CBS 148.51]|uniref:Rrn9 domain-containing protein n=1 Tax=Chaetomium globosum (strain ATCC 6205 / CBS 148.51 / DSM 1962 / NBRC 6347 / NRRL 1970) TaxID=306901 RepID=Q2HCV0_CHAGB|nr:uncharacterized protein CHGG_01954 [Chaetomium globosum CBS 148.51]EAQ93719.1 hypothetical protein CHGG_01954 [Chaetomium globosum CBS 148.51]